MFVSFHFRLWPRRAVPRHKGQAHPEGGGSQAPSTRRKTGTESKRAGRGRAGGFACWPGQGTALLGEVRGLEVGIVAPTQRPVLCFYTGHHGRGEEDPRSGCTQGSTPSHFQLEDSGFSSFGSSPLARSPWSRSEQQYGLKLHELKRLKLSQRSAGSKLSKHSGHLAGEVLFRLFIAVGAKRVQSWRQTFPKLGAVWSGEGEREFSQARFQQTLTPSLRYVLLSVTW